MHKRQREGIVKAKKVGKYKDRAPTVMCPVDELGRLKGVGVTPTEIVKRLGINRMSADRVLRAPEPRAIAEES